MINESKNTSLTSSSNDKKSILQWFPSTPHSYTQKIVGSFTWYETQLLNHQKSQTPFKMKHQAQLFVFLL